MPRTAPVVLALLALAAFCAAPARAACPDEGVEAAALGADRFRDSVRCLVNERRAWNGRGFVRRNRQLGRAAFRQNQAMVTQGFFAHHWADGTGPGERVVATGYADGASRWAIGENLGWGWGSRSTPLGIVTGWMESAPHRANLLRRSYDEIGISVALASPGTGYSDAVTVTAVLGMRKG